MNICILGDEHPEWEEKQLIREAGKIFDKVVYVPINKVRIDSFSKTRAVYKSYNIGNFDCVLPRISRHYMHHAYTICSLIQNRTFLPMKPEGIIIGHNKFLTLQRLSRASIEVPKTFLASTRKAINDTLNEISYPIVIKLLYGEEGKGVMFADSKSSAVSLIDAMESLKHPLFVEEYLPSGHKDLRILVIGDEIVGSMRRHAMEGERRANVSIGGSTEVIKETDELKELAFKTSKAIGLDICGVDIIEDKKPLVIEANVFPGFHGLSGATGKNIARHIVRYMKENVKK